MIISFHTPEERWATTLWEVPIYIGEVIIKSVLICPCAPIYPDESVARLVLRDSESDVAYFLIQDNLKRFQICNFELTKLTQTSKYLTLLKEPTMGKNIALPPALVQVETW